MVSAEGELPFAVTPDESGRYADLSGPGGIFATIDYGDGSEPPRECISGHKVTCHNVTGG